MEYDVASLIINVACHRRLVITNCYSADPQNVILQIQSPNFKDWTLWLITGNILNGAEHATGAWIKSNGGDFAGRQYMLPLR